MREAATGPAATGGTMSAATGGTVPAATGGTMPAATGPAATGPWGATMPVETTINLSNVPKNVKGSNYSTVFGIMGDAMSKNFGLLGMRKKSAMVVAFSVAESDKLLDLGPFFSNDDKPVLTLPMLPWDIVRSYPEFCETLFELVETAEEEDEDVVNWNAVTFPDTMPADQKDILIRRVNACVEMKQENFNFMYPLYGIVAATTSVRKSREQLFMFGEYAYTRPATKNGPMETVYPKAHGYTLLPEQLQELCWGGTRTSTHMSSINVTGALSFAGDAIQPRFDPAQGITKTVTMVCAVQLPPDTMLPTQMHMASTCQYRANGDFAEDISTVINLTPKDEHDHTLREIEGITVPIGVKVNTSKYVNKSLRKNKDPERKSSRSPAICSACCKPPSGNCSGHGHPCSAETVDMDQLQAKRQRTTTSMNAGGTFIDVSQRNMTHLPAMYKIKPTTAAAAPVGVAPVDAAAAVAAAVPFDAAVAASVAAAAVAAGDWRV